MGNASCFWRVDTGRRLACVDPRTGKQGRGNKAGPKWFSDPRVFEEGRRLSEAELSPRLRREFSDEDVRGVLNADYFWLLAPGRQPSGLQQMVARTLDGLTDKERAVLDHR